MNTILVGINHKTAPIGVREKFFLTPTQQNLVLSELKSHPKVCEAFVLSTCNRTEFYVQVIDGDRDVQFILDLIANVKKIKHVKSYRKHFYILERNQAVQHLLKVSTGLDSLVLGEKQILGQIKASFNRAREKGMFGKHFNILSNVAVRTGKKAHNETDISCGGSSVSWAAMVMVERVWGSLKNKSVLIVGAGKMSELAVNQICKKTGKGNIYIMNRTEKNAQDLAKKYQAIPVPFCDIKEVLNEVDICICAAGAPHYILEKNTIKKVMKLRKHRELILVDISMPRNIDPAVRTVDNVSLLMIDDLDKFVDSNMKKRRKAVPHVEKIVDQKTKEFYRKIVKLQRTPGDYYIEPTLTR